ADIAGTAAIAVLLVRVHVRRTVVGWVEYPISVQIGWLGGARNEEQHHDHEADRSSPRGSARKPQPPSGGTHAHLPSLPEDPVPRPRPAGSLAAPSLPPYVGAWKDFQSPSHRGEPKEGTWPS